MFRRLGRPSLSFVSTGILAGVPGLERPPAVAVALRRDQLDWLGHALVRRDAGFAQVLESPQHVVVPPCRESETGPRGAALAISLDHFAARPPPKESALEEVLMPAEPGIRHLGAVPAGQFVFEQAFQHADRGVK